MGSGWRGAGGTTALGATLVILAGVIDAPALYVPGLVLLLLSAGATLWVHGSARGVEVRRHLSARRVVEDEPLLVEVEISAGRLAPPAGERHDTLLRTPAPLNPGRRRTRVRIRARFARRGRRELPVPEVVVRDPLSLVSRSVAATGTDRRCRRPLPLLGEREAGMRRRPAAQPLVHEQRAASARKQQRTAAALCKVDGQ